MTRKKPEVKKLEVKVTLQSTIIFVEFSLPLFSLIGGNKITGIQLCRKCGWDLADSVASGPGLEILKHIVPFAQKAAQLLQDSVQGMSVHKDNLIIEIPDRKGATAKKRENIERIVADIVHNLNIAVEKKWAWK